MAVAGAPSGRRAVAHDPGVVREVGDVDHQRVAVPAPARVAHAELDAGGQVLAAVERDVARMVVPLVHDDDRAGHLQELVRVVADRQVAARHRRRQALDARIEELQLVLVGHDLDALLDGPVLQRNAAVGRIDDHRPLHALHAGGRLVIGEELRRGIQAELLRGHPLRLVDRVLHRRRRAGHPVPPEVGVAPRRPGYLLPRGRQRREPDERDHQRYCTAHLQPPAIQGQ